MNRYILAMPILRPITFQGRTQLLSQWAEELGLSVPGLHTRLTHLPVEEALTPVRTRSGPKPIPLAERLWRRVEKSDGCWLWTGNTNGRYGILGISSRPYKNAYVHRISWEIHFGPIPDGLNVLHRCDVPLCVKPAHLFLGTRQDNLADMHGKGRARGRFSKTRVR